MEKRLPVLKDYDAVIFDLDGTLYDSMGLWEEIDIEYLARLGLKRPADLQEHLNGLSFQETASYFKERFALKEDTGTIMAEWLRMAEEAYNKKIPLKPGAREILIYLKENGIPAAIASSNHYDLIRNSIAARSLEPYISVLITCDDVRANKPDPSVYLTAARKLGVDPKRCLVFEDVVPGILSGIRAGMTVCAVRDEQSKASDEEKARLAGTLISDFRELIPAVDIPEDG